MKSLWIIIKKELKRIFTDKRMLASLILPGLLIFVVYSIMGDVMTKQFSEDDDYVYTLRVDNEPLHYRDIFTDFFAVADVTVEWLETEEDYAELVASKELDLYVVFEVDFAQKIIDGEKPTITFNHNTAEQSSITLMSVYQRGLSLIHEQYTVVPVDYALESDMMLMIISGLLPFLLITFLFAGSMAVAPESIAGEKERGTIANLLITPVKRSTIALGKIIALSTAAFVSATSSFLGLFLSLPKLIGVDVSFSLYSPGTIIGIFAVLLVTILLFIVLISIISAFSKSIKEATSYAGPLMIITMIPGIISMMGSASTNSALYVIPVFNSVNVLLGLFSETLNPVHFILTISSNLLFVALGTVLLARMFNSEKMMFRR